MPILLPVALCVVGVLISLLPPAEVVPARDGDGDGDGGGSWLAMGVATLAVVSVIAFAVHQLGETEVTVAHPAGPGASAQVAGNP